MDAMGNLPASNWVKYEIIIIIDMARTLNRELRKPHLQVIDHAKINPRTMNSGSKPKKTFVTNRGHAKFAAGIFSNQVISSTDHRYTVPKTNIAPENRPLEKEIPIENHHF